MQEEEALQFYERITQGTDYYETIELEHKSGSTLKDVKMHPVSKQKLAAVIQKIPPSLMADSGGDADEIEMDDEVSEEALAAVNKETVSAFEKLLKQSLSHDELTKPQMDSICEYLDFETMYDIGGDIIEMSIEQVGQVRGFRKQG